MANRSVLFFLSGFCLLAAFHTNGWAATLYVWPDSPNPAAPYNTWTNAARTIQAAIDAAADNDFIWVTNGMYNTGGRTNSLPGSKVTNRVDIYRPVTVCSVNGPTQTVIAGRMASVGGDYVRCVAMTSGARLIGFMLTNGHASSSSYTEDGVGGGVWGIGANAVVSNCTITGCSAGEGGGSYVSRLANCRLIGNSAGEGGGASFSPGSRSRLDHCLLLGNSTYNWGGGAAWSELYTCMIISNYATAGGGGAHYSVLSNCIVEANYGQFGGGFYSCTAGSCILANNSSYDEGGGATDSTLYNCLIVSNSSNEGAGAQGSDLVNCTVVGNTATEMGGGVSDSTLYNCIVYYNNAPTGPNWAMTDFISQPTNIYYTCTTPAPIKPGNLTNAPSFADPATGNYRLAGNSPCVNAGLNQEWMTGARDLAGSNRILYATVDMGAYEFGGHLDIPIQSAAIVGPAVTRTNVSITNRVVVAPPGASMPYYYTWSPAPLSGQGSSQAVYRFTTPGTKALIVSVSNLFGRAVVTGLVHIGLSSNSYVAISGADANDGFSWAKAKRTIQAGVDAINPGYTVWVSNGVYDTGGRPCAGQSVTNRVAIHQAVAVRSVNGPLVTTIVGYKDPFSEYGYGPMAIRGVYLTNLAVLSGFTVSEGSTDEHDMGPWPPSDYGGGIYGESELAAISNCHVAYNSAHMDGGGVFGGSLYNCEIYSNSASSGGGLSGDYWFSARAHDVRLYGNAVYNYGGGARYAIMNRCLIEHNAANGVSYSILSNCIVRYNTASWGGGAEGSTLVWCLLAHNRAWGGGGGAAWSRLINCTVVSNTSDSDGGGLYSCTATNCIIYFNSGSTSSNWYDDFIGSTTLFHSCTAPLPSGIGNQDDNPLFINVGADDFRLRSNSPCADAGTNLNWMTGATDIEGKPRILNVKVDMGAYELIPPSWDSNANGLPDWWEWQYSHSFTGMSAGADLDTDRFNNLQEYIARTDPTNSASFLGMTTPPISGSSTGIVVRWQSVEERLYDVERAANATASPTLPFGILVSNVPGETGHTTITDTTATARGPYIYRVRVHP